MAAKSINHQLTKFQQRVLEVVKKIPRGKLMTYRSLARAVSKPRAARAVGKVLSLNNEPVIVPCHRVVRSDGHLGGYRWGLKKKIYLLKKEGIEFKNGKIKNLVPQ